LALSADVLRRAGAAELFDSRYDATGVALTGDAVGDQARIAAYYQGFGPSTYVKVQSAHLQGGNVLHRGPTRGVVDNDLKVHGVDNLWILDSSVFPAPITLNIQYTTMALARYAALRASAGAIAGSALWSRSGPALSHPGSVERSPRSSVVGKTEERLAPSH
jgi:choline dehydrogenase-like flavoprotein